MCMGLGCNAAGVVGCRIIDSPRERLIAIITNTFVPCNGRFPGLIALITIFFAGAGTETGSTFKAALILCLLILFGIWIVPVLYIITIFFMIFVRKKLKEDSQNKRISLSVIILPLCLAALMLLTNFMELLA